MEVPIEYLVAGFVALAGAVVALWRAQVVAQRHCIQENQRLGAKLNEFDQFQRGELLQIAKDNVRQNQTLIDLLGRAIRVIKRHESQAEISAAGDGGLDDTPTNGRPSLHERNGGGR